MTTQVKVSIENKKANITDLLHEMTSEKLQQLGFKDLLIESIYRNEYGEIHQRYGSIDGWKTLIDDIVKKEKISIIKDRFNDVDLSNSYIEDSLFYIQYEGGKKSFIDINYITGVFIMKQNDDKIY